MAFKFSRWTGWLLKILAYLVVVSIIMLAVDWYRSADVSTAIPDNSSTLRTLDGNTVSIVEQSYQAPVLLYFWATWCPYCEVVSPMVTSVAEDHQVLTIAFSSGTDSAVSTFAAEQSYQFPIVNDETGVLARRWGVSVTPTLLVVRNGEVSSVTTGLTTSLGMRARLELAR